MAPHTLPQSPANWQISKHGVLVLWGFGIKVRMDRDAFLAEWGVGLKRYQVRLSRVEGHKLRRVVLIGSDGYFSLEALRFITDVGASLEVIDKRGKALMVCSPVAPSVSKLRRAQSLALTNGVALAISKEIISEKLADQAALVRDILNNPTIADTIARIKAELSSAESIEAVRLVEARGSKKYWSAWTGVAIRWARKTKGVYLTRGKYFLLASRL
jgi:CRISPR/Cas system-associated endonuclease Cas1